MRSFVACLLGALMLLIPALAFAGTFTDITDPIRFLLSRIAASRVGNDTSKPSCVAITSTPTPHLKEKFLLAWGSSGAVDTEAAKNTWPLNNVQFVTVDTPGIHQYTFTFYGVGGVAASCAATVTVTS